MDEESAYNVLYGANHYITYDYSVPLSEFSSLNFDEDYVFEDGGNY